jgi:hypothetical protein
LGFSAGTHLYEAKASRLPAEFVGDHSGRFHGSMRREDLLELAFGYRISQTAHV